MDQFLEANHIRLHYLRHAGTEPPLILTHGLTDNAHSFDGLINPGIQRSVLAVDLRGRGLSDKPEHGYGMAEHRRRHHREAGRARYGSSYRRRLLLRGTPEPLFGCPLPDRIEKTIVIDAAARLYPDVAEMVAPSINR